jgi:hypothetical protein
LVEAIEQESVQKYRRYGRHQYEANEQERQQYQHELEP